MCDVAVLFTFAFQALLKPASVPVIALQTRYRVGVAEALLALTGGDDARCGAGYVAEDSRLHDLLGRLRGREGGRQDKREGEKQRGKSVMSQAMKRSAVSTQTGRTGAKNQHLHTREGSELQSPGMCS